ncbi:DUF6506 family protein [Cloacibacillus sp. An23]|uniref:DUF6506 family protein n=1 Tax=Cloacibacillus sp. An23 TaxID=1965591 RepID=UPI001EF49A73|nr:DUF6506 family protein [Cloacibacillus sp. An23]
MIKFAFIIMGDFNPSEDRARIHGGAAQMIGVSSVGEACREAAALARDGVGCIELCGAFKAEDARRVIEATGNNIPIGYVTHLPEQDDIFAKVFGNGDGV